MSLFASTRFAICSFMFFVVALFLYSFTQIDLSLTFSQASFLQDIQKGFQYIGYFNRPLATELFFIIIIGLSVSYIRILDLIRKKKITVSTFVKLVVGTTIILLITYNAFSYDLFNYIFDAKIVTQYGENPYLKKALDFPSDPMLSFMRWTHRTYPYGPLWLGLTVPLSYAGMQIFAVTFGLFKVLMAMSFLGCVYGIYRIMKIVKPDQALLATGFFALNPLVLVESLVSAHNDIVMLFFAVISVLFLVKKQYLLALLVLAISIGIKFATVLLLPVFLYVMYQQYKKKTVHWENIFYSMSLMMIGAVLLATFRTNFQPWYILYIMPFAALTAYRKYIFSSVCCIAIAALFNYIPYLFSGNWDPPIPFILNSLNMTAFVVAVIILLLLAKQERKKAK